MLPIPTPYRIAFIAASAILAGVFFYHRGEMAATERYLPQIERLRAQIAAADAAARTEQLKHKEVTHAIQTEATLTAARIRAHYERLLHTRSPARACPAAERPAGADATPGQPASTGPDIAFERACALDALTVVEWQRWAHQIGFPVSD